MDYIKIINDEIEFFAEMEWELEPGKVLESIAIEWSLSPKDERFIELEKCINGLI